MPVDFGLIGAAWESYAEGLIPGTRQTAPLLRSMVRLAFYAGAAAAFGYVSPEVPGGAAPLTLSIRAELDQFDAAVKRGDV